MTDLFADMVDATTPREAFTVTDTASATWTMRKLAAIRRKQQDIAQTADAEIERIAHWAASESRKLYERASYFESLLADYHQRVLAEDERAKTINLPHGRLTYRAQQPEYHRDEDALLAWARASAPELVATTERADWAAIKERARVHGDHLIDPDSGEVIPGVTVTERPAKFAITLDEGENA